MRRAVLPVQLFFQSCLEALVLVTALSVDAFVASLAYGAHKIKIPFSSVMIINVICSGILAGSLLVGTVVRPYIPAHLTSWICFSLLFVLGLVKLFDSSIKRAIQKSKGQQKEIEFSAFDLNFILKIYADPEKADRDQSRTLNPMEAVSLAVAVSLDGLAVGFGAGLASINLAAVLLFSLVAGIAAVLLGGAIGRKVVEQFRLDLSWISGVLLILLAIMKLC